jgi:hypothetical protein
MGYSPKLHIFFFPKNKNKIKVDNVEKADREGFQKIHKNKL